MKRIKIQNIFYQGGILLITEIVTILAGSLFNKLLDPLLPTNVFHDSKKTTHFFLGIGKDGLRMGYGSERVPVAEKKLHEMFTEEEYKKIKNLLTSLENQEVSVERQGNVHRIKKVEPLRGNLEFYKNLTYEEIYEHLFLRGKELEVKKLSFSPETLERYPYLKDAGYSWVLKSTEVLQPRKYRISFRRNDQYEIFGHETLLHPYPSEEGTMLKNHFSDDWLLIECQLLESGAGKVKYQLNERATFSTEQLKQYNALLQNHFKSKLTLQIIDVESNQIIIAAEVQQESKGTLKEIQEEYLWIRYLERIQDKFGVQFKIPFAIKEDDYVNMDILRKLLKEEISTCQTQGVIKMNLKPTDKIGVMEPIRNTNLVLTHPMTLRLFSEELHILKIIEFKGISELGVTSRSSKRRWEDGFLQMEFVQRGDRVARVKYVTQPKR